MMTIEQKRELWVEVRRLGAEVWQAKAALTGEPGVGEAELFLDLAVMALGGARGALAKLWKAPPEEPGVGVELEL